MQKNMFVMVKIVTKVTSVLFALSFDTSSFNFRVHISRRNVHEPKNKTEASYS